MDYWKIRAKKYNKLQWVKNKTLLKELIKFCNFKKSDIVLDAGCGTGTVACGIFKLVSTVVAIDKSKDMLNKFKENKNIIKLHRDIQKNPFGNNFFNQIIARMLFHHLDNFNKVFKDCYKMLRPKGFFVIQEGGIWSEKEKELLKWYFNMMKLKEKRHNFTQEELIKYFKKSNFKNIKYKIIIDKNFCIDNWLKNSGQNKKIQKKIYNLHLNASDNIKKKYNMKIKFGKIFIDSPVLLIKGQKI